MQTLPKDPSSVIDYAFDWSDWLPTNDVITATDWLVSPQETGGIEVLAPFSAGTTKGTLISGGRAGQLYRVTCRITTNTGKTADRSVTFRVQER